MSASTKVLGDGLRRPITSRPAAPSNADWEKIDAVLEDLPSGIPILPPEDAVNFEKYTHRPRHVYVPGDGWKNCARALEKYDAELCRGYREEIDTLLVFAGLFSAVVTAFTVESYQWLQADPNDAIIILLSHIAQSIVLNGTTTPLSPDSVGLSGSVSARINIYWFLALSLSLTTALVAILCKQWIREFEHNVGARPKDFVGIHHTKLEGLNNWRVGDIISLLPLLLQFALALFALGILELLWRLNTAVAAVICIPAIIAFLFYAATTILPVLQFQRLETQVPLSTQQTLSQCPYKSPQALLAFRARYFYLWIQPRVIRLCSYLAHLVPGLQRNAPLSESAQALSTYQARHVSSWDYFDTKIHTVIDRSYKEAETPQPLSLYRSLRWVHQNLYDDDVHEFVWHCLWEAATEPNREYTFLEDSEESLKQGIAHITSESMDVSQIGVRALALGYLLGTSIPRLFVAEACAQNLNTLDAVSADYLTGRMSFWLCYLGDTPTAVTILRVTIAYVRLHIREPIGELLYDLTGFFIDNIDHKKRTVVAHITLALYLYWLRTQPVPYPPATVEAIERMAWFQCIVVQNDPDTDYSARPEHLRQRPGVLELAELLSIYVEMLVPEDPLAAFSTQPFSLPPEKTRPIVRELLEIARNGGVGDASGSRVADAQAARASFPNAEMASADRSPVEAPARSISTPLSPSTHRESVHGSVSHARRLMLPSNQSAALEHPSTEQQEVPRDALGLCTRPSLHAVVIHETSTPGGQRPAVVDGAVLAHGDRDSETMGDDVRPVVAAAVTKESLLPGSGVPLHDIGVHAEAETEAQTLPVEDRAAGVFPRHDEAHGSI